MTVTDKQGGPRPFHALVGDDKLAAWSDEDKRKLNVLEAEFERDGRIALERMRDEDPVFFVQLMVVLVPHVVREMLENVLISEGLTNADVYAKLKKMRERKH
jgi:hypothetical protein